MPCAPVARVPAAGDITCSFFPHVTDRHLRCRYGTCRGTPYTCRPGPSGVRIPVALLEGSWGLLAAQTPRHQQTPRLCRLAPPKPRSKAGRPVWPCLSRAGDKKAPLSCLAMPKTPPSMGSFLTTGQFRTTAQAQLQPLATTTSTNNHLWQVGVIHSDISLRSTCLSPGLCSGRLGLSGGLARVYPAHSLSQVAQSSGRVLCWQYRCRRHWLARQRGIGPVNI